MKTPGFSAEASLYKTRKHYYCIAMSGQQGSLYQTSNTYVVDAGISDYEVQSPTLVPVGYP
jgi:hypothetical protein